MTTTTAADKARYQTPAWMDNVRLIASAPDLLAALTEITDRFENALIYSGTDPEYAAIAVAPYRAAITKATA